MSPVYAAGPCCKPAPADYSEDVGARPYLLAGSLVGLVVLVAVMMIAEEVVDVQKEHLMQVEIVINQVLVVQTAAVVESAKIYLI